MSTWYKLTGHFGCSSHYCAVNLDLHWLEIIILAIGFSYLIADTTLQQWQMEEKLSYQEIVSKISYMFL